MGEFYTALRYQYVLGQKPRQRLFIQPLVVIDPCSCRATDSEIVSSDMTRQGAQRPKEGSVVYWSRSVCQIGEVGTELMSFARVVCILDH